MRQAAEDRHSLGKIFLRQQRTVPYVRWALSSVGQTENKFGLWASPIPRRRRTYGMTDDVNKPKNPVQVELGATSETKMHRHVLRCWTKLTDCSAMGWFSIGFKEIHRNDLASRMFQHVRIVSFRTSRSVSKCFIQRWIFLCDMRKSKFRFFQTTSS